VARSPLPSRAKAASRTELASGKTGNIHETMLAATQAELSFNLMVQVRNKALEAYNEIMRMPV
jgi:flagellar hook-basal body complex protein FliE